MGEGFITGQICDCFFDGNKIRFNKSLKKGKKLRTGSLSDDMYYDNTPNVETGTNLVGITLHVEIKNNKVVKIIRSAM